LVLHKMVLLKVVRFEVFTAVSMIMMFRVLAPCSFVGRCQRFGKENILSPSSGLRFSETLASAYETTRHQNPSHYQQFIKSCLSFEGLS
jgi:hypothetical protein